MEGYTAWDKYQTEATIHLLRWNSTFTDTVWSALSEALRPYETDSVGNQRDSISAALLLCKENPGTLADLATTCGITEKQLWALLITKAEPGTTSLDRLSDARDRIHRITAQEGFAQQQRLHANFNLGSATRQDQSDRAKKNRGKFGGDNPKLTMADVIANLATAHEYGESSAKELWPVLLSKLDEYHLDPQEDKSVAGKLKYIYDLRGKQKTISFEHFSNVVSESRKKKSEKPG